MAAYSGFTFSLVLILLGFLSLLLGDFIGGLWLILLGFFLRAAAQGSYQQLLVRRILGDTPIRGVMQKEVRSVPPSITLDDFIENHVYRHHFKMFPVTENGQLVGCVSTDQVKEVPRAEWSQRTVQDVAESCADRNTVSPDTDALQVFKRMHEEGRSRLMVVEGDHLEGVVSLKDVTQLISLKMELEEE
jgi:CBS domain-containing protein